MNVGSSQRSWNLLMKTLTWMQEAGISVIRVYMPIQDEIVLDKIADRGNEDNYRFWPQSRFSQ